MTNDDVPRFLRFKDLQERRIVNSPQTLRHFQIHEGFPLGKLLGPNTRVWTVDEINGWLATRLTDRSEQNRRRVAHRQSASH